AKRSVERKEGVDGRDKPGQGGPRLCWARYKQPNLLNRTAVGLSRPPTSSPSAPSNGKKAWMAGTSPATGIPGCVGRATNNRTCSTGQPWDKPGHKRMSGVNHPSESETRMNTASKSGASTDNIGTI